MTGILHALVEDAAREAGCTVAQILGSQQTVEISSARHRAMARAYEEGFSMRQIGAAFRKDHKVVSMAVKRYGVSGHYSRLSRYPQAIAQANA